MSALDKVVALASGYRQSQIAALLIEVKDRLDPELWERVRREAPTMSNAEAEQVLELLRAHRQVRPYRRRDARTGKVEEVEGYARLTLPQAVAASLVCLAAIEQEMAHRGHWGRIRHVRTEGGAKEYHEPIGSLIVAKPREHRGLDHFLRQIPLIHDPRLHTGARADEVARKIRVSSEFEGWPEGTRRAVLAHEAAHLHKLDDWYLRNHQDWELHKLVDVGHLSGQTTPGEIMAEAYAAHWTDPEFLRQHAPRLVHLVREGATAVGLPLPEEDAHVFAHPKHRSPEEQALKHEIAAEGYRQAGRPMGDSSHLAVAPARPEPPPAGPAVTVPGGVTVTAKEIEDAIAILNAAQSTNVKHPLRARGSRLHEMDYQAISKQVLKEHPELKLPPGTKQKHVGQVKANVLHYLAGQLKELGRSVPPVGDGPHREHITPDRLRPGDTVLTDHGYPAVVKDVQPTLFAGRQYDVTVINPKAAEPGNFPDFKQFVSSTDGGPAVIRVGRGGESQDQPWDSVMAPEHPEPIGWRDIRVGDRLTIGETSGVVEDAEPTRGGDDSDIPGVSLDFREDSSRHTNVRLYGGEDVTRLVKADANAEERIEQARQLRRQAAVAADIHRIVREGMTRFIQADIASLELAASHPSTELGVQQLTGRSVVYAVNQLDISSRLANELAVRVRGTPEEARRLRAMVAARLEPLLVEVATALRQQLIAAYENATPLPEDYNEVTGGPQPSHEANALFRARRRALEAYKRPDIPFSLAAARALAQVAPTLEEGLGEPAAPPQVPVLPPGTDLKARVAAYRAALPADPANVGSQVLLRQAIKTPRLAELERGVPPVTTTVELGTADRAQDGGPGPIAMRHLDIVTAAGRDLDAELGRRVEARLAELDVPGRLGAAGDAERKTINDYSDLFRQVQAAHRAARDKVVRESGLATSYHFALVALRTTRHPDLVEELRSLILEANKAGAESDKGLKAALQAAEQRKLAAQEELHRLQRADADAQREVALELLREVREGGIGGHRLTYRNPKSGRELTDRGELAQAMRWAEQHFPKSWLEQVKRSIPLKTSRRGWHSRGGAISLSKGAERVTGAGPSGNVAVHELAHEMEDRVPGLVALEEAYLWSRTATGEVGSRQRERRRTIPGYKRSESGYPDNFSSGYSGKVYDSYGDKPPRNYELFTTATQSLFGGSKYLDPSFRQWALGTLALL